MTLILLYLFLVLSWIWNLVIHLLNGKFNLQLVSVFTKQIHCVGFSWKWTLLWKVLLNIYAAFLVFFSVYFFVPVKHGNTQKSLQIIAVAADPILQAFQAASQQEVAAHAGYPSRKQLPFLSILVPSSACKLQFIDKSWINGQKCRNGQNPFFFFFFWIRNPLQFYHITSHTYLHTSRYSTCLCFMVHMCSV